MAVRYALPKPTEPLLDQFGKLSAPWYNYLRTRYGDDAAEEIIASIEAQIADLLARVEALEEGESARIVGPQSVSVVGSLQNGLVQLTLVNDEAQPLPVSFYATNESQEKGWQLLQPNWVPNPYADYLVDENGDYLIDENGNFLTSNDPQFDPLGSADAAFIAASDYATSIVDALTPESLGMGVGFDQTTGSRLADIDTMFGQPPTFFSCASTATGIPVAISGQGAYIPFSATAGMQIYASASVQDVNRRLFYRAGSGSAWGNWIEFGFRYWNAASAASGNISPNLDLNDAVIRTALAVSPTIANPTGTKHNGRPLTIRVRDNGTARALTWGTEYRAMGSLTLPATTVINKTLYVSFLVNADENTLDLMQVIQQP